MRGWRFPFLKNAGTVNKMDCMNCKKYLSLYLDGELTAVESRGLEAHLESCAGCRAELALDRQIKEILNSEMPVPETPANLAAGVTAAIQARPVGLSGFLRRWPAGVAAAAAVMLITTTALGYGLTDWTAHMPIIGKKDTPEPVGAPFSSPGLDEEAEPPEEEVPGDTTDTDDEDLATDSPESDAAAEDRGAADGQPAPREERDRSTGDSFQIASSPEREEKVFLNQPRTINSTLVKIGVGSLVTARDHAITEAGRMGASLQMHNVQSGSVEVLRFSIAPERGEQLANRLTGLGTVMNREKDSRNISGQFADTLEQYQEAVAERNRTSDPDKTARLDQQINSLEEQLTQWTQEADQHVVVLILQRR